MPAEQKAKYKFKYRFRLKVGSHEQNAYDDEGNILRDSRGFAISERFDAKDPKRRYVESDQDLARRWPEKFIKVQEDYNFPQENEEVLAEDEKHEVDSEGFIKDEKGRIMAEEGDDLDDMTVPQLREYAKAGDIEIPPEYTRKGEIINFIRSNGG